MEDKRQKRKKLTIFRMFLVPLIMIMLMQSMIIIGTLVVRKIGGMLQEYSSSMMSRLVENRKGILQNDMIQRWASVRLEEDLINQKLKEFLESREVGLEEFFALEEMQSEFLEQLFPECLDILQNNSTTGVFFILTGKDMYSEKDHAGFFIRDSDPNTNSVN